MRDVGKLNSLCAVDECTRKASCSLKSVMFHTSIEAELSLLLSGDFWWNYLVLAMRNHSVKSVYELRNYANLNIDDVHKHKEL